MASKSKEVLYRNKSKITQIFYMESGEKRSVMPRCSIYLPEEFGRRFRRVLEPVKAAEKSE